MRPGRLSPDFAQRLEDHAKFFVLFVLLLACAVVYIVWKWGR